MKVKESIISVGEREIIMRSPEPEDAQKMLTYLKTVSEETDYMIRLAEEITMPQEQEENYIRDMAENPKRIMIALFSDDRCIGDIGINAVGEQYKLNHRASLGIAIVREFWGKGLGKRLMTEGIRFAREAGYERLELGVFMSNERARRLYRCFGFEECGKIPKAFRLQDGSFEDEILMSMNLK